jgi:hypothetical protein
MKLKVDDLRPIVIKMGYPASGMTGVFHSWCKEPFYNESGTYLTKTFALIELTDGSVKLIEPDSIRFLNPINTKVKV